MKNSQLQNLIPHFASDESSKPLSEKIVSLHLQSIGKNSNIPSLSGNILYQSSNIGGTKVMEKQGNIVKEFMIGKTRIKINDAYCFNKTPADVEKILAGIAKRAQIHLIAQATSKATN